jgi:hypothetical protein
MNEPMGHRVNLFLWGISIAGFCAVIAILCYVLTTMMMDPAFQGSAYRAEVQARMGRSPQLTGIMVAAGLGTLFGFILMGWSFFGRFRDSRRVSTHEATRSSATIQS